VLYYYPIDQSLFGFLFEKVSEPNWEEISQRDIVKNSIPIILLEEKEENCKMKAQNFDLIVDHEYFIFANELELELEFDRENDTLIISCNMIKGDKSRLNVWYVIEESSTHSKKFQYFVTPWSEEIGNN
jgi:hypothetical protein